MIVGIPVYKDLEGLSIALQSFNNSTKIWDKIILIVSDADEEMKRYLDKLDSKFEIIHTPKEGPWKAYDKLFEIAKERQEDLFLTQTDVLFPQCYKRDWLADMKEVAKIPECGIVTCYGGGGQSGPDFIDGFEWVGAWATYIPIRTINKIGGYDKNIVNGWGVDIEYSYRIAKEGLKTYTIDYWVHHHPNYIDNHEHENILDIENIKKEAFRYMRKKHKLGEFKE